MSASVEPLLPFDESLPIITSSERRAFKRCPQKWWWEYREGLRAYEMNDKLWFGIGIHMALAQYYGNPGYKRNMDYIDLFREFCDEDDMSKAIRTRPFEDAENEWVRAKELGEAMLLGHHERWGGDPEWDVISTEHPFAIGIPDPKNADVDMAVYNSTFDGVYRDKTEKMIKLMEHKTAASIALGHLPMDDQGGAYWAFAQIILQGEGVLSKGQSIRGIEYNFLRKSLPDARPKDAQGYATNKPGKDDYVATLERYKMEIPPKATMAMLAEIAASEEIVVLGSRSMTQGQPLFIRETVTRTTQERATQIRRVQSELTAMEPFRSGENEPYKNPTRDCSWECPFFNMCQLHDQGADWEEFKDGVFMVRDPYGRYRKSASEGL
jgi:hypothetical protein